MCVCVTEIEKLYIELSIVKFKDRVRNLKEK
jgi:hypothetical protein